MRGLLSSTALMKLNMMINYYVRLEEVSEVKIELFLQSRICTTIFFIIDPLFLSFTAFIMNFMTVS